MSKLSITLDDIFGQNNDIIDNKDNKDNVIQTEHIENIEKTEQQDSTKTTSTKKYKTKNSANKSDDKINNSKSDIVTNNIDNILNNGLVKFENKIQTSMFFVCYKAMTAFCNDIKNIHNITFPKEFIDNQAISIIPSIIKEYTGNLKKRCKKVINLEMICIGRKLDNKQCTRKKHNDSDFCKSHFIKLSNGRIDQPTQVNLRNKRGRKRKVEFDPRQYDNDYITLWEDIINGEKVLVDINNNIYTFDLEAPQYIGKKDIFNKSSFLESSFLEKSRAKNDELNSSLQLLEKAVPKERELEGLKPSLQLLEKAVPKERELEDLKPLLETRELEGLKPSLETREIEDLKPLLETRELEDLKPSLEEREIEGIHPSLDKIELNIDLNNKKVKDKKIKLNKKTAKIAV